MILNIQQYLSNIGLILVTILAFIVIIGIVVLIHELGHFIFAKKANILCHEFSIGMGPVLFQKKKGETIYSIRAIPIGGYVSMADGSYTDVLLNGVEELGLNLENSFVKEIVLDPSLECDVRGKLLSYDLYGENSDFFVELEVDGIKQYYNVLKTAEFVQKNNKRIQLSTYERSFESKTLLQRFLTIFAGPVMNFILALLLYIILGWAVGVADYSSSHIGSVSNGYPASGILQAGDEIKSVDGKEVANWQEFSVIMDEYKLEYKQEIEITFIRDNKILTETLYPSFIFNNVGVSSLGAPVDDANVLGVQLGITAGSVLDLGMSKDDILVQITVDNVNHDIYSWEDIASILSNIDIENVTFTFYKKGEDKKSKIIVESYGDILLNSQQVTKYQYLIGISPETKFSFIGGIKNGFTSFTNMFTSIGKTIGLLFGIGDGGIRQVGIGDLAGPIGIFDMIKSYVQAGLLTLISFTAMLSVNLGLLNLLPIPALDGGRIIFLIYELITGKRVNKKFEETLTNIMFILLMILFIYVAFNDTLRMFG